MMRFKKVIPVFILSVFLFSCGGDAEVSEIGNPDGIKVSGNITGANGEQVSLWVFEDGEERMIDSATVIDNSFTFWTETKELREYVLDIGGQHEAIYLFPDESADDIEITGTYPGLTNSYDVSGDENSKDYKDYWLFIQPHTVAQNQLMNQYTVSLESEAKETIMKEMDSIALVEKTYAISYIKENPASPVSWIMLQEFYPPSGLINFDSTDFQYFELVSKEMRLKYPYSNYPDFVDESLTSTIAQIDQLKNGGGGDLAPDLNYKSPEGESIALSSLRGQVVLIDFWASWCGPCRMENPNVVKTYDKYKDKGFTIYSVSLDTDVNKWKEAIKADNLTWPNHVSDLKGWQSEAAAKYNVNSIPATFLLDKDGRIIDQNLRGAQLEQKLQEILG